MLALLAAHHIFHVSRIKVNCKLEYLELSFNTIFIFVFAQKPMNSFIFCAVSNVAKLESISCEREVFGGG
jgi:hypothetical protein